MSTLKKHRTDRRDRKNWWAYDCSKEKKKKQSAGSRCDDSRVFPEKHEFGGLERSSIEKDWRPHQTWRRMRQRRSWRRGQCSQASQVVITVLQVLVALVAARVPWWVSQEAAPVQQQLLLRTSRLAASLGVAASCKGTTSRWDLKQKTAVSNVLFCGLPDPPSYSCSSSTAVSKTALCWGSLMFSSSRSSSSNNLNVSRSS